jgi:hypothetical protein
VRHTNRTLTYCCYPIVSWLTSCWSGNRFVEWNVLISHATDLSLLCDMESTETCDCYSGTPSRWYRSHVYESHWSYSWLHVLNTPPFHWFVSFDGPRSADGESVWPNIWDNFVLGSACPSGCLFMHNNSFSNRPIRSAFFTKLYPLYSYPYLEWGASGGSIAALGSCWVNVSRKPTEEQLVSCEPYPSFFSSTLTPLPASKQAFYMHVFCL